MACGWVDYSVDVEETREAQAPLVYAYYAGKDDRFQPRTPLAIRLQAAKVRESKRGGLHSIPLCPYCQSEMTKGGTSGSYKHRHIAGSPKLAYIYRCPEYHIIHTDMELWR